jgi:hypothetical protein
MKLKITLLLLMAFAKGAFAQTTDRKLVGTAGDTFKANGYELCFSIGEPVTGLGDQLNKHTGQTFLATIGFQQPHVAKTGAVLLNNWVTAYPNPATTTVRVDVHGVQTQDNIVTITNILGQKVVVPPFNFINGSTEINVSGLPRGTYIIAVTEKITGNTAETKIIKL